MEGVLGSWGFGVLGFCVLGSWGAGVLGSWGMGSWGPGAMGRPWGLGVLGSGVVGSCGLVLGGAQGVGAQGVCAAVKAQSFSPKFFDTGIYVCPACRPEGLFEEGTPYLLFITLASTNCV